MKSVYILVIWLLSFVDNFIIVLFFFFFKQKTAYEMRISDWSSDVCSSDLIFALAVRLEIGGRRGDQHAVPILDQQRRRLPAGARSDAARFFEQRQKIMADKGVAAARQRIPRRRIDRGDGAAEPEDRKSTRLNSSH